MACQVELEVFRHLTLPLPHAMSCQFGRAIVGGLLVGFGSSMGNGCTSGHGICGLARFSFRSLVYTITFMAAGAAVATTTHSAAAAGINTQAALRLMLPSMDVVLTVVLASAGAVAVFAGLGTFGSRWAGCGFGSCLPSMYVFSRSARFHP